MCCRYDLHLLYHKDTSCVRLMNDGAIRVFVLRMSFFTDVLASRQLDQCVHLDQDPRHHHR